MVGAYGTKETKELFAAMGDVSVLVFRAQKQARGADGKLDAQKLAQAIVAQLMTTPAVIEDLKAAADNISDVPKELKDLSLGEIFDLMSTAGGIAARCAAEIN